MTVFEKITLHIVEAKKLLKKEETAGYFYLTYLQLAKQELEQAETIVNNFQKNKTNVINKDNQQNEKSPSTIQDSINQFAKQIKQLKAQVEHKLKLHKIIATKTAVDFFELGLIKKEERNIDYQKKLDDPEIVRNIFRAQINKLKFEGDLKNLQGTKNQLIILINAIKLFNTAKQYDDLLNEIKTYLTKINLVNGNDFDQKISPINAAGTAAAPPTAAHQSVAVTTASKKTAAIKTCQTIDSLKNQCNTLFKPMQHQAFILNAVFVNQINKFYRDVLSFCNDNILIAETLKNLKQLVQNYVEIKASLNGIDDHDYGLDKNTVSKTIQSHLKEITAELERLFILFDNEIDDAKASAVSDDDDDKPAIGSLDEGDLFTSCDVPEKPKPPLAPKSPEAIKLEMQMFIREAKFNQQQREQKARQTATAAAASRTSSPVSALSRSQTAAMSPLRLNASPYLYQQLTAAQNNLGQKTDDKKQQPLSPQTAAANNESPTTTFQDTQARNTPTADPISSDSSGADGDFEDPFFSPQKSSNAAQADDKSSATTEPVKIKKVRPTPKFSRKSSSAPTTGDTYRMRMLGPAANPRAIMIPIPSQNVIIKAPEFVPGAPPKQLTHS